MTLFADRLLALLEEQPALTGASRSGEGSTSEDSPSKDGAAIATTPTDLPWQDLSEHPESHGPSSWRGTPSVLLEGCLRSLPLAAFLLATASAGAAALMVLLQLALLPLEKRVRTRSRLRRWFGALTLLLPGILFGLTILRAQAGFASALRGGALWTAALPNALAKFEIQSWEDLVPEAIGVVILFSLSGTRIRLLPRRWTLTLVALSWLPLFFLSDLVERVDLSQAHWELVMDYYFVLMLVPLGVLAGVLADLAELVAQWLIFRDEHASPPRIASLWSELVDALAAGRAPSWDAKEQQVPLARSVRMPNS